MGEQKLKHPPVVVGFGPAGMFCAWELAKAGYKPIVFEQGKKVEERLKDVEAYMSFMDYLSKGEFDEDDTFETEGYEWIAGALGMS